VCEPGGDQQDGNQRAEERVHKNSQPPQQPGDGGKKAGGGPEKTIGEAGADGRTISSLSTLRAPYRYHSSRQ
jgi:hypothetical protein